MTELFGCQILYIATGFIAFVTGTYGHVTGINVVETDCLVSHPRQSRGRIRGYVSGVGRFS